MKNDILSALPPDYPWKDRIVYLPSTCSTNDDLKKLARQGAPQGTALIAGHQTGGRGRMGRVFHSPQGKGLYLSLLLRPNCAPGDLMHLTCAAGLAARDAVRAVCDLEPQLKWTNALVVGRKKLGGILTELGLGPGGSLEYVIIGIGINCLHIREDFPPELRDMAVSLAMLTDDPPSVPRLAASLLTQLEKLSKVLLTGKDGILARYRNCCITVGQEISLLRADGLTRYGRAVDIDGNGALIVRFRDGTTEAVSSGEVSVRGLYGYV